jgi:sugar/nucleoside kinase (ribokinase family)
VNRPAEDPCPEFVAVGHVTRDLLADGERVGGTVTYAALTAQRLGLRAGVVTSAGPELGVRAAPAGVAVVWRPAAVTTTFENRYEAGTRRQRLLARAAPLSAADVPAAWRRAGLALIGPVAGECAADLVEVFPEALLAVTPQGWLRAWDAAGDVVATDWRQAEYVLPRVDVAILSMEDTAGAPGLIGRFAALAPCLVVTDGGRGAEVYRRGEPIHVPAFPRPAADPTGAGDVFAAAFLIELARGGDPIGAARFGHAAASFVVEGSGAANIPDRGRVAARLAAEGR